MGAVRWAEVVRRQASNGLYLKPPGDGIPAAPRPVHLAFVCVVNKSFFEISNRCRLKWHNCCQLGCSAARQLGSSAMSSITGWPPLMLNIFMPDAHTRGPGQDIRRLGLERAHCALVACHILIKISAPKF